MADDLATQLQQLQNLRALLGEDVYAQSLAKLRAQHGAAAVDALLETPQPPTAARGHVQVVSGRADVAVAGDVYGSIYLAGRGTPSTEQILAAYLHRVRQRCSSISLHGVYEQKTSSDLLQVDLQQVYTQLATTTLVERETFDRSRLQNLDILAFAERYTDDQALPQQLRQEVLLRHPQPDTAEKWDGFTLLESPSIRKPEERLNLHYFSLDELAAVSQQVDLLTFFGPQLIAEAVAAHPRLVLLGEPGSGKSTALRYLALNLAEAGIDATIDLSSRLDGWSSLGNHRLLPIYLPLLPFARRLAGQPNTPISDNDLWMHIAEHLEAGGRYEGLAAAIAAELDAGHVILLLDGLDEVGGADARGQVVRSIQAFADNNPTCRIVITCRTRAYLSIHHQPWHPSDWPTVRLDAWNIGQMKHFIAAWYTAAAASGRMSVERREERIASLQRAITRRDLQRLGMRPLLLTIMVLVHFNDGHLPEDRATLYSRCVDLLLGKWEMAHEAGSAYGTLMDFIGMPDRGVRSLRPLLEAAALRAHESGSSDHPGRLTRETLHLLVGTGLQVLGHTNPWMGAERFLEYVDVRAGLLQMSDASDTFVFPHQLFQEYLAGLELVRGVEFVQRIMEHRHDERWRGPILLGIGHLASEGALAMPYQLLSELLVAEGRTPTQEHNDLLLAAEIAEDVGWERLEHGGATFKRLRRDLAFALTQVVEGRILPVADRVRAGLSLRTLGDLRPGVCALPPMMIPLQGGCFVIGSSLDEAQQVGESYRRYYLERGDTATAAQAHTWPENEINDQLLEIPAFAIARYPVTNAQYGLFIADDGYNRERPWWGQAGRAWLIRDDAQTLGLAPWQSRQFKQQPEFWTTERFGVSRLNSPVVGVSWYEAMAFCRWLTQHSQYNPENYTYTLPSEAEWEYAARGAERRRYPWGDTEPDAEHANFADAFQGATPVGCYTPGATPEGITDMAGNVWEWTRSRFQPYPYGLDDERAAEDDPARHQWIARGASWHSRSIRLRAATRNLNHADNAFHDLGFRLCQRLPTEPLKR